ncbi:uncharacterized protein LOC113791329 isoform X2 [Dermatophagoides pteronyssinus]|uniref:Uncharacterized protein LOC113791329 isoform X2 n=1 Tax=Dermatophagoides pteronyssinus TaxID=6956 RepID=A0A6P6XVL4_DERPT|nr:uncharacterized protein LOC113791329 isoform X2 [Dermatophagoides pteronyssinus]
MKKMDNFSDPIGYLQQLCSKIGWLLPVYKDLGQSKSSSSSDSKKNAATKMIKALNDHYRSTITVYNLQSGIPESKIRLLLSDIHSIKTIKMLYDMNSKGMAKAEVVVDKITDMLVAMKLYNGYSFQNRKLSVTCQAELIKKPVIEKKIAVNKQSKRKRKSKRNRINRKFATLNEEKPKQQPKQQSNISLDSDDDDYDNSGENEDDKISKKDVQNDTDDEDDNVFIVTDDFIHPNIKSDRKPNVVPLESKKLDFDSIRPNIKSDPKPNVVPLDSKKLDFDSIRPNIKSEPKPNVVPLDSKKSDFDSIRPNIKSDRKHIAPFDFKKFIAAFIRPNIKLDHKPTVVPFESKEFDFDSLLLKFKSDRESNVVPFESKKFDFDSFRPNIDSDCKPIAPLDFKKLDFNSGNESSIEQTNPSDSEVNEYHHTEDQSNNSTSVLLANSIKNSSKFHCAGMIDGDNLDDSDIISYETIVDDDHVIDQSSKKNPNDFPALDNNGQNKAKETVIDESIAHYYQPVTEEEMKQLQNGSCTTYIDELYANFMKTTMQPRQTFATTSLCDGLFTK